MKLKDLPKETIIHNILLLMPDDIFKQAKETDLTTKEVMFTNPYADSSTGFFVKTRKTGNQVFPIFGHDSQEVLEWVVLSVQADKLTK